MDRKKFSFCGIAIAAVGAAIGWSVSVGNTILPIFAVIAGLLTLYIYKKRVDEVMVDERTHRVGEKAAATDTAGFCYTGSYTWHRIGSGRQGVHF